MTWRGMSDEKGWTIRVRGVSQPEFLQDTVAYLLCCNSSMSKDTEIRHSESDRKVRAEGRA